MGHDIDAVLREWAFEPGEVQVRRALAGDGRVVLQMRLDLGVLQLEVAGRPDGSRPGGFDTSFDYLRHLADEHPDEPFFLSEEHCREVDREFLQFYHRRVCWLALKEYDLAIADADHNLALMDFVKKHSPSRKYTLEHEQYRGFVMFHRTQAAVARALEREQPEEALDLLHEGLASLRGFFDEHGVQDQFENDSLVRRLRALDKQVRKRYQVKSTLREQIEQAVAEEHYELAAELRDRLQARRQGTTTEESHHDA